MRRGIPVELGLTKVTKQLKLEEAKKQGLFFRRSM
jgi:hypothetical protein